MNKAYKKAAQKKGLSKEQRGMVSQVRKALKNWKVTEEDFNMAELEQYISMLPKGKAIGHDGIANELLQALGPNARRFLLKLFNLVSDWLAFFNGLVVDVDKLLLRLLDNNQAGLQLLD